MNIYRRLLSYLRPYLYRAFLPAVACMVLFSATNGVLPFLVEHVFDDIFADRNRAALKTLPFLIVATFTLRSACNFGHVYLMEYVGQRIIENLRNELNAHLQSLSLSFFQRHPTGTLISRVTNDTLLVRQAITQATASMMRDFTTLVVLITVAFWKDWVLAGIAFVAFPATIWPLMRIYQRVRRLSRKGQGALGYLSALLQETIQGSRVVKAFGMESYEKARFASENHRLYKHAIRAGRLKAFVPAMVELLAACGIAGVVWYGGSSVIEGERTQGGFVAFLTAMLLIYQPFKHLTRTNTSVQNGLAGAERLFEILDERPEVSEAQNAKRLIDFTAKIRFDDVSFRYKEEWVLKNLDLTIEAGDVVALVGPSGGGKSTLADLIPRFYEVSEGSIRFDEQDIRNLTLSSLRSHIAIVTQDTFLFNDNVHNNIAYGMQAKSETEIIEAAKAAHAHDFIMELPEGYQTQIGELGVMLSGGQRQRLAIARALLKDAPVLILDEATSSLDNESERLVQNAVEQLMSGRTVLVIAHRLSTIRRADQIVVLDKGRIVEQGPHGELLANNAHYKRLYEMQFVHTSQSAA